MAKTKKKRRRKQRGTQGGRVDTRPARRPRSRAEAKAQAAQRRSASKKKGKSTGGRQPRALAPPTWKSSFAKGGLAAVLFFGLFAGLFHRPLGASAAISGFMLVFYVPMSFYVDNFMYKRKLRELTKPKPEPKPEPKDEEG
ncbi:MAG: hypothetical protein QOD60_1292 [Solirubrobacterales bacterium]|nr:hypothetical protein [Solirubrobacterales bacterium]